MFARFLPRETSFFDFFESHARLTIAGINEFVALCGANNSHIAVHAKRIKELEHEADVVTHNCAEALHKTFITPIDRDSIYRLITRLDDVVDYIESAADRFVLYDLTSIRPEVKELANVLVRCGERIEVALRGLRNMKNAEPVLQACVAINELENEADAILRNAIARLFKEEKDPIAIIKWKEIFETLETATDRCEDVAQTIEGLVLEHA